jgi:hypothetical protein
MNTDIRLLADNSGGITLQVTTDKGERFQRSYDDAVHAIRDAVAADAEDDVTQWDGNDLQQGTQWLDPTEDDIRNGGYRICYLEDLREADRDNYDWGGWGNISDMISALEESKRNAEPPQPDYEHCAAIRKRHFGYSR